jgi:hypothetical protein
VSICMSINDVRPDAAGRAACSLETALGSVVKPGVKLSKGSQLFISRERGSFRDSCRQFSRVQHPLKTQSTLASCSHRGRLRPRLPLPP